MRLYIDPGTGSMLFTILLSVIGSLVYFFPDVEDPNGDDLPPGKRARRIRQFFHWSFFQIISDTGLFLNQFAMNWNAEEGKRSI